MSKVTQKDKRQTTRSTNNDRSFDSNVDAVESGLAPNFIPTLLELVAHALAATSTFRHPSTVAHRRRQVDIARSALAGVLTTQ